MRPASVQIETPTYTAQRGGIVIEWSRAAQLGRSIARRSVERRWLVLSSAPFTLPCLARPFNLRAVLSTW